MARHEIARLKKEADYLKSNLARYRGIMLEDQNQIKSLKLQIAHLQSKPRELEVDLESNKQQSRRAS